jgi:hypothetical protein
VLSAVGISLAASGLLIGLTGAWSPCGFSMVETIGPTGHTGGRRTTLAALVTFTVGAIVGGAATFGLLALAGALVGDADSSAAYLVAAGVAAAAALVEARGTRIVPQVRRQLPEHWRRFMPMPLAAGLYGVLLGLGFTTFVLSYGVWALAGISFALGDPAIGIALGALFGVGRAIPVIALAPAADRPWGIRVMAAMSERPALLRGFRLGDAVALAIAAAVLTATGTAQAAPTLVASDAADPGFFDRELVFERRDGSAVLQRAGGNRVALPGTDPAIGGPYIAVIGTERIRVLRRTDLHQVRAIDAPGADAVAISANWLAWRAIRESGGDRLVARRVNTSGTQRTIERTDRPAQLSRPSLDEGLLVYAVNQKSGNRIVQERLRERATRTLLKADDLLLTNPSVKGPGLLYVRASQHKEQLRLLNRREGGAGRILLSRDRHERLWSTALTGSSAFYTRLTFEGRRGHGRLFKVPR